MHLKKLSMFAFALCAVALFASPAEAQVTKGKLRLSLDTKLLGFQAATVELDRAPHSEVKYRTFDLGFGAPELGIGFGYTVIDGLVIGARFGLAFKNIKTDPEGSNNNDKARTFGFRILPYVEYGFNVGKVVPFVTVTLGYRNDTVKSYPSEEEEDWFEKTSTNAFVMGAGGGAHFFLVEAFSIDATLLIMGDFGKYTWSYEAGPDDDKEDYKVRAFDMNLFLGLSGWI